MRSSRHRADTGQMRDAGFRPYRDLAVRVLARAFQDLTTPVRSSDRESARVFLAGSGMMRYWCRVASLDPFCVVNHAEKLTAKQCRTDALAESRRLRACSRAVTA
jgi:hypothetical protein